MICPGRLIPLKFWSQVINLRLIGFVILSEILYKEFLNSLNLSRSLKRVICSSKIYYFKSIICKQKRIMIKLDFRWVEHIKCLKLTWFVNRVTILFTKHINVDIWLKIKVEPTFIYRLCFNVCKRTSKQRR